jgi:hypothetical protein
MFRAQARLRVAFESGELDLPDFYFTGDDYRYRFEREAKERFLDLIREHFNSGVKYKGRAFKWDTVLAQKTVELGRYLAGKSSKMDFSEPSPTLNRGDERELRRRILSLSLIEARKLGIGKSTSYYLRKRAMSDGSFMVHGKTRAKIERK